MHMLCLSIAPSKKPLARCASLNGPLASSLNFCWISPKGLSDQGLSILSRFVIGGYSVVDLKDLEELDSENRLELQKEEKFFLDVLSFFLEGKYFFLSLFSTRYLSIPSLNVDTLEGNISHPGLG